MSELFIEKINVKNTDYELHDKRLDELFEQGDAPQYSVIQAGSSGTAFGDHSIIEGTSTTKATDRGITSASTSGTILEEWYNSEPATDKFSLTMGLASHIEGNNNLALGKNSHAEGNGCAACQNSSHAEGTGSIAYGHYAHAEGRETLAMGNSSHSEGEETQAIRKASHAEGSHTVASGETSHAEGKETLAMGKASHAEGYNTKASGENSHVEGYSTSATSANSHAEGLNSIASGPTAHVEGEENQSLADCSHVEGYQNVAQSDAGCSHAEGKGNTTSNKFEHAEGCWNLSHRASNSYPNSGNTIHSIGVGTNNNSGRANAVEVMQNGNIYIKGVGGYEGTSIESATTLQSALNEKAIKAAIATVNLSSSDVDSDVFIGPYHTDANYLFVLENQDQSHMTYMGLVTDGQQGGNAFDVKGNIPEQVRYDKIVCQNGDMYLRIYYHDIPDYQFSTSVTVTNFLGEETHIYGTIQDIDASSSLSNHYTKHIFVNDTNLKTINGDSIIGEGNISTETTDKKTDVISKDAPTSGSTAKYVSEKAVVDYVSANTYPIITTKDDFRDVAESGSVVDSKLLHDVIEENENVISEALLDLNGRINILSGQTSDAVWEKGEGENSVIQKGSNGTAFGANTVVEGSSVTNAIERGITSESTDAEIIAEWSGSTPDTDKFSLAKGDASHVEGNNNLALGKSAHAEGNGTISSNDSSHSEGTGSQATGKRAHAEGLETIASGNNSHAEGKASISAGESSHAEGQSETTSSAKYAHAEGYKTQASGKYSHTEGEYTQATAQDAHAEGAGGDIGGYRYGVAGGYASHAEGKSRADADYSHAEGYQTQAKAIRSHAEGYNTKAAANAAHAEGSETDANGEYSHTEGIKTIAENNAEHAEGKYNVSNTGLTEDKKTMHSVGIGTSSQRKNAFEIMQSGDAYLYGVGGYSGTTIANVQTLQAVIADLYNKIGDIETLLSQI